MKQHKLTVVMTAYNIARHLPRFFDCMSKQTFTDYCLVVVDDGSADNSLEVSRQYAAKDDRIKVIASEHLGIPAIKNLALGYIDTPLAAFADGDDYFDEDYLQHLADAIEKYDADLAISRVQTHKEGKAEPFLTQAAYGETVLREPEFSKRFPTLLHDRRFNYVYAKMYRTEMLREVHIDDDMIQGEDTVMVFRYLSKAKSIVLIDDEDYHYVKYTSRSVTSYNRPDSYRRMLVLNKFMYEFCAEQGWLNQEMLNVLDGRMMLSGNWAIDNIINFPCSDETKIKYLDDVFYDEYYSRAYERQKDNLKNFPFRHIPPQDSKAYLKKRKREEFREKLQGYINEKKSRFLKNKK